MTKRQTPPYLAPAADLYRHNRKPDNSIYIHVGQGAWHKARERQESGNFHSLLPDDAAPRDFKWPVYKNDVIVKFWSYVDGTRARALTMQLLDDGADMVMTIMPDYRCAYFRSGDL